MKERLTRLMKVMFIGCGNMGKALVEGFSKSKAGRAAEIFLNDSEISKAEALQAQLNLAGVRELQDAGQMDAVILAVKPDVIATVCRELNEVFRRGQLLISIAAGVSLASLRNALPEAALCRVMPNLAAMVAEACSSLSFDGADAEQIALTESIFSACGRCFVLPEKAIDAVVGVSGSGPAYVMMFIEAMADGGVKMGLPRDTALAMAIQTLKGSAILLEQEALHPARVKDMVCSPGGTSIAAVHALEEMGFRASVMTAVETAATRNHEMAKQS